MIRLSNFLQKFGGALENLGRHRLALFAISLLSVSLLYVNYKTITLLPIAILLLAIYVYSNGQLLARPVGSLIPMQGFPRVAVLIGVQLALIGGIGGLFVVLFEFTETIAFLSLVLVSLVVAFVASRSSSATNREGARTTAAVLSPEPRRQVALIILYSSFLALWTLGIYLLIQAQTVTPSLIWREIPLVYLVVYSALTATTLIIIHAERNTQRALGFVVLHAALLFLYIAIVVGTQYGSDPWVRLGDEMAILQRGEYLGFTIFEALSPGSGAAVERYILEVSRGAFYALVTGLSRFLGIDVITVNKWLAPAVSILILPATLFLLGKLIWKNDRYALYFSFLPSIFFYVIVRGAYSLPAGLGFAMFPLVFLFWALFVVNQSRASLFWALGLTALFFFFHSASFVVAIQIGAASLIYVAIRRIWAKPSPRTTLLAVVLPILALVWVVPLLDTLERTTVDPAILSSVPGALTALGTWIVDMLGITGMSASQNTFVNVYTGHLGTFSLPQARIVVHWLAWAFAVLGVVAARKLKSQVWVPIFAVLLVLLLQNAIVWYMMDGLHPIGRHMDPYLDLFKLPFVALGIVEGLRLSKQVLKAPFVALGIIEGLRLSRQVIRPRLSSPISRAIPNGMAFVAVFGVVTLMSASSYSVDPGGTWVSANLVEAMDHIASNFDEEYCVLAPAFHLEVLVGLTAGEVVGGGFEILRVPIGYYFEGAPLLNAMIANPSRETMEEAMTLTDSTLCFFLVLPQYNSQDLIQASTQLFEQRTFGDVYLFWWPQIAE